MSLSHFKENVLPAIFNREDCNLVDCEIDSASTGQDQFMSNVVFLTAVLEVKSENKKVKIPLLVKFEPSNKELRAYLNTTVQFYNEVLMYDKILPFLDRHNVCSETFAKFHYGVGQLGASGSENLVIVEDLRPSGFKLTEERAFISVEHLSLAMSKLGRFHALSYAAKQNHSEEFYKVVKDLKESTWVDENGYISIVKSCFHRPAEYLMRQDRHVQLLQRLLESFDRDAVQFMKTLVAPEEPLAVVCHGDFCRNNILFKYDTSGLPTDVKFFDIATSRYSSPAVDISFFLFLNSSKAIRKDHWDDLLATYHHSLSSTVPGTKVPSLEDIKKELLRKALYGFVHCAFFLPEMLYEGPYDNLEDVMNSPQDEMAREYALVGGEEGTRLLADMVEELIERGCLTSQHKFIV